MATENPNPSAPEERVSPAAEDVLNPVVESAAAENESASAAGPADMSAETLSADAAAAEPAAAADETPVAAGSDEEPVTCVDFADEEAALAVQAAGLELGEEMPEEAEATQEQAASVQNAYDGKSKSELTELFARMLEERPVQSLRRDVEALFAQDRRTKNTALSGICLKFDADKLPKGPYSIGIVVERGGRRRFVHLKASFKI